MMTLIEQLREAGFEVRPNPPNIRLRWTKSEPPDKQAVLPLLVEAKRRKVELLAALSGAFQVGGGENDQTHLPRKAFLQVKAIEAEAFAKGWLHDELWHPRFVGGRDKLHKAGLGYVMDPDEIVSQVTEKFIELVNRRGVILKFYRFKTE